MFDHYSKIFDTRGALYHEAMCQQPIARIEEFSQVINRCDIHNGLTVCDIPSGGGYAKEFIPSGTQIIEVETSKAFHQLSELDNSTSKSIYCDSISNMPLEDNSIDRIISISGLHHMLVKDRCEFYHEALRVLKPNGKACIADVAENTNTANFLNIFVDENNSEGHKGIFLTEKDVDHIKTTGFDVRESDIVNYHWRYDNIELMIDFTRKMFGIDQCSDDMILQGIEKYLGYETAEGQILMNWSLQFIQVHNPSLT